MRLSLLPHLVAAVFLFCISPAHAFEMEDQTLFSVDQPQRRLSILSTADIDLFAPVILAFQQTSPQVEVSYVTVSSTELMRALYDEGQAFDIAVSSAMDLQTKLANDGFTQAYSSSDTDLVPWWGKWRDHVFSFSQEPAAIVISRAAFDDLPIPKTRQELITLLRNNTERFDGRVGTYDIRTSGLGYLFATQDARTSETFWRLTEVMGSLETRLYCCSGDMINDVSTGKIAVAYNVLGSYARARHDIAERIKIIEPEDFTTVMLRSAIIPVTAENPADAGLFIDHLVRGFWGERPASYYPFPQQVDGTPAGNTSVRPIRLGPGLLVYLDDLKRRSFLKAWENAILQR